MVWGAAGGNRSRPPRWAMHRLTDAEPSQPQVTQGRTDLGSGGESNHEQTHTQQPEQSHAELANFCLGCNVATAPPPYLPRTDADGTGLGLSPSGGRPRPYRLWRRSSGRRLESVLAPAALPSHSQLGVVVRTLRTS